MLLPAGRGLWAATRVKRKINHHDQRQVSDPLSTESYEHKNYSAEVGRALQAKSRVKLSRNYDSGHTLHWALFSARFYSGMY